MGSAVSRPLTQVAPGVWTATAEIWTSLTTLVEGRAGGCLVVDPGITVAEIEALAVEIAARGWHVEAAFSTHPHWDHVLWHALLGDAPRWATAEAVAAQETTRAADRVKVDAAAPGHDPALFGRLTSLGDDATHVPWSGPRALVVPHRGHVRGHAGLVLPGPGVLVAGDMLSDLEIPLLDLDSPDPVGDYRAALDLLESAAASAQVSTVVPGHGHVGDAAELARRLAVDRAYLDALEEGREVHDPRLSTPWLADEHARHVSSLREAGLAG